MRGKRVHERVGFFLYMTQKESRTGWSPSARTFQAGAKSTDCRVFEVVLFIPPLARYYPYYLLLVGLSIFDR